MSANEKVRGRAHQPAPVIILGLLVTLIADHKANHSNS
jgi:hypothetical protein